MPGNNSFAAGRREELEAVAAKYTDRPAEAAAELRAVILDDIAEGLALIGITGGLVDILHYAAALAFAADEGENQKGNNDE